MPDTPVRLTPQDCPKCGAPSWYVIPLPALNDTVDLAWFCRDCHHEWVVTRRDAGENTPRPTSAQRTIDTDLRGSDFATRDCVECHKPRTMQLQNVERTLRVQAPLLYVCSVCGAMLTIPSRVNAVSAR